ncbi:hypothetical protein [Paractinoplanes durhamensis]|uniref:Uncharacterized protein n=1 Tax=Paractinoplanes durhamensis TaxID=113563 RepID=A0ABQ3YWQ9_9ACTN|nr:hypothetical protein [Actinoplanes durhamensis]GIE02022.1 hypothetical protein Adu01nite_33720 [Actinoplanes durhamensis]
MLPDGIGRSRRADTHRHGIVLHRRAVGRLQITVAFQRHDRQFQGFQAPLKVGVIAFVPGQPHRKHHPLPGNRVQGKVSSGRAR